MGLVLPIRLASRRAGGDAMTLYPWWALMVVGLIAELFGMASSGQPRWWKVVLMALALLPIFLFAGVEVTQ